MKKHGNINDLIRVYTLEVNDLSKLDNVEIFKILENRLGIHKTEEYSFEVISKRLLKEYRMGKLGRFLLEEPSDFRK